MSIDQNECKINIYSKFLNIIETCERTSRNEKSRLDRAKKTINDNVR